MNLNKATIIGRLTNDPELKDLSSGTKLSSFGVATNRRWLDPQTQTRKEMVEFHNVLAWGKLAELCKKYLKKGRQVYVEGRLQTRKWQDKDSVKHNRTEIVAENMIFLDKSAKILSETGEVKPEEVSVEEVVFAA